MTTADLHRLITLRNGQQLCPLGQGTYQIGHRRSEEISALRRGIDLGLTLIDTAEMHGTEDLVGEAVRHCRHRAFIVSKVLPSNASYEGTKRTCERSLQRLGTDPMRSNDRFGIIMPQHDYTCGYNCIFAKENALWLAAALMTHVGDWPRAHATMANTYSSKDMNEFKVEIVTELDEVEILRVMATSPEEAEVLATDMVENGETHLDGREVISARAL